MIQAKSPTPLNFKVSRGTPELVTPGKPTPYEFKPLSDLENLDCFRVQIPGLMVYSHIPSKNGVDPVEVIRKAIAETLVFYYPFAGRLRESPSGKLVVECTGEGVLFTEADADVTLEQFGYPLTPPFPCLDQLLFDVPSSSQIFNSPLVLVQVTRLKCGSFIFGLRYNHTISDAAGLVQFMSAIGEMARGATSPSILPIWERHILNSTLNPQKLKPPVTKSGRDISDESSNDLKFPPEHELCYKAFFLSPAEISALKRRVPPHFRHCSSFEIVTASVWKCRVIAFQPNPKEETSLIWSVNLRSKLKLPSGFYGNAAFIQMSNSTAKEIIENPLSYTLQLVRNAKDKKINIEDYAETLANIKVNMISYNVSDWRYTGFEKVDFGWGEAVYGGPDYCGPIVGCHMPYKNKNGENGIMLPLCLPTQVMERFEKELNNMLKDQPFIGEADVVQSKL
ncbi:benzyl alcohol O-benzoyltransferase-like [Euphorbia lathyris]|uniref:benzyl alcohol O-benzoyltransferase-like n=1 Tax=Euphorbia lathyris TaxID=212925 RepID=UPI0033137810